MPPCVISLPAAAYADRFHQKIFIQRIHFSILAVDRKKVFVLKSWHKSDDRGKVSRHASFREQGAGESLAPNSGRKNTPGVAT